MGRIVDLCGEIAAAAEEGPDGLDPPARRLGPAARGLGRRGHRGRAGPRPRQPAPGGAGGVRRQPELAPGRGAGRASATTATSSRRSRGQGALSLEAIGQLARRVARLEEILEAYREGAPPDRRGFDALQRPPGRPRHRGRDGGRRGGGRALAASAKTTRTTDERADSPRATAPCSSSRFPIGRGGRLAAQPDLAAGHGHLAGHRGRLRHPDRCTTSTCATRGAARA